MKLPSARSQPPRERVGDIKRVSSDYSRLEGGREVANLLSGILWGFKEGRTSFVRIRRIFYVTRCGSQSHCGRYARIQIECAHRSGQFLWKRDYCEAMRWLSSSERRSAEFQCFDFNFGVEAKLNGDKMKARKPLSDEILTAEEVAKSLRIHPSTIYRLAKRGDRPAFSGALRLWDLHRADPGRRPATPPCSNHTKHALTRNECRSSRRATLLTVAVSEQNSFLGNSIDMRCLVTHHSLGEDAEIGGADVVTPDDQYVRLRFCH